MNVTDGIHVAIPSYRRAGRVAALAAFPSATLYVPESQLAQYVEAYGADRCAAVPDAVDGNLARKLNWMLDRAAESGVRYWLRVDDDVEGLGRWELGAWRRLDAERMRRFLRDGFRMADEAGVSLWGVNVIKDRRAYSVFRPLKTLAPILGPFGGHVLEHGLRYDPNMGGKEDYDFWLQTIAARRGSLRFDAYHYVRREETTGGWYSFRTHEAEQGWADAIVAKWGRRVIKYDESVKNLLDGRVTVPIPGC